MTKPKRRRMPANLRALVPAAEARMFQREATPEIAITGERDGYRFGSPYRSEDLDGWTALLFDAFGTRSAAAMDTFLAQLTRLCPEVWSSERGVIEPAADELRAAIQIVRSMKPRNEAEACIAAQAVAVHIATMKLGEQVARTSWAEPRTVAVLAKAARTFAAQVETMDRLKGKRKTVRQKITVKQVREVHHHEHKHIQYGGGGVDFEDQPLAAEREGTAENINRAGKPAGRAALPGPDEADG